MKRSLNPLVLVSFLLMGVSFASAQTTLTIPAASPTSKVTQQFATAKIEISYSRPSTKGRVIFGDLVPFGELWRTGANASTKIMFGEDVKVEGNNVPAGKYALYTIPAKDEWTIILSKDTTLWGTDEYKQENDLIRFRVKPMMLPAPVETFTMDINNIKSNACDIRLLWEKTVVSFAVTADIDTKIMAQIDEAMKGEKPPYWQAASYYFENGKDINQAYEWVNKAIAARPEAYWMMTAKAKMEMKMGKYSQAVATANQAKELAMKEKDNSYIQQNDKTIAEAKAKM